MTKNKVDEILQSGIHGPKELKPEERKRFLGTIRERVEGALTAGEVYQKKGHKEIESWITTVKKGEMLLNGDIDYAYLSPYIQLAIKHHLPYTIVENQEADTNIGLVVTHADAVDKPQIGLDDIQKEKKKSHSTSPKQGLLSKIKRKLFKNKK
ncbi:uncharacterized protein YueI [Bacillus ectoiniformans]|uniref:YueI family protein n=1 Tax=Bacillus ectoiniformans TaxID=1494429 RepID=UPI00308454A4|nr:uncharacterized protein YueI [Bacillus ectoiniformans]